MKDETPEEMLEHPLSKAILFLLQEHVDHGDRESSKTARSLLSEIHGDGPHTASISQPEDEKIHSGELIVGEPTPEHRPLIGEPSAKAPVAAQTPAKADEGKEAKTPK